MVVKTKTFSFLRELVLCGTGLPQANAPPQKLHSGRETSARVAFLPPRGHCPCALGKWQMGGSQSGFAVRSVLLTFVDNSELTLVTFQLSCVDSLQSDAHDLYETSTSCWANISLVCEQTTATVPTNGGETVGFHVQLLTPSLVDNWLLSDGSCSLHVCYPVAASDPPRQMVCDQ